MPTPEILVVAPPPIRASDGIFAAKFVGAEERCIGLANALCRSPRRKDATSSTPAA